ncbi:MAG TPA: hypothetical protein VJ917_00025 [Saprospiraceae bacterium]|nr:hypothetical protein [Saprospiraceae bacterium]
MNSGRNFRVDFSLDPISWAMIIVMIGIFMYVMVLQGTTDVPFTAYLQAFGLALLVLIALVGVMSIPVLIICYVIKRIPDIDYSVWGAFAFTILALIVEGI